LRIRLSRGCWGSANTHPCAEVVVSRFMPCKRVAELDLPAAEGL
jgi:hypothetical protein